MDFVYQLHIILLEYPLVAKWCHVLPCLYMLRDFSVRKVCIEIINEMMHTCCKLKISELHH